MKKRLAPSRPTIAASLAAAAFFSSPAAGQEAPPQEAQPPVVAAPPAQTPPPAEEAPVTVTPPAAAPAPARTAPAPVAEAPAAREERPAQVAAPAARTRPAAPPRQVARPDAAPPAIASAPAAASAPVPVGPAPEAIAPAADMTAPPLPAPAADPLTPPVQAEEPARESGGSALTWLLVAALVLGAAGLFAWRRRRPAQDHRVYHYEAASVAPQPVAAAPALDDASAAEADAPAGSGMLATAPPAVAAAPGSQGDRPWLELLMQPGRAGVSGDEAVVEFVLTLDNQGSAPAEDVRICTWMVPGGPSQQSETERMLIEPPPEAKLPAPIPAGEGRRIQSTVALPTVGIGQDALLPVVVADARYTLPDGSEGRTSASFAVGVPDGEELAHFSILEPSGLHEGVVARPLGEPERA